MDTTVVHHVQYTWCRPMPPNFFTFTTFPISLLGHARPVGDEVSSLFACAMFYQPQFALVVHAWCDDQNNGGSDPAKTLFVTCPAIVNLMGNMFFHAPRNPGTRRERHTGVPLKHCWPSVFRSATKDLCEENNLLNILGARNIMNAWGNVVRR